MKKVENMTVRVSVGEGKYRVEGIGIIVEGKGLVILILGGESPHIGAVALAIPRPSLKDPRKLSATVSVLTLSGHKDDEIARPISENVAKNLNQVTVTVAGVHIDEASDQDISKLVTNSMKASKKLIIKLRTLTRIA